MEEIKEQEEIDGLIKKKAVKEDGRFIIYYQRPYREGE